MLLSTRYTVLTTVLLLHHVSCRPPPSLPRRNLDGPPLQLGNQILADTGNCVAEDYKPKDILMPEFAPYDEKQAKIYRYRKQISVNLGSWFVQENWMNPSLVECASGSKSAELDVASGWDNPTSARSALEKHWDTWITEDDFAWLADTGVNTVRLPIGYWSLGSQYCQGTPFKEVASVYERSWPRILRAISWAAKHNIGVLVDLHGAVGSQNGQSHSGTSDGQMHLFDDDDDMKKTTDVLVYLTKQLVPISNVVGIQILNEPRNVASLPDFYARTIDTLRRLSPDAAKFPFYIHDGFNLERFAKFVGGRKDFVVQDHHSYFVFTPSDASTPAKDHTSNINNGISSALASASKQARRNLVVDEWSCALTPESLSSLSSNKQLAARKSFCTSQANVYLRETAGWSFWSYKTENCDTEDGWCFRKAVGRSLPAKFSVWDVSSSKEGDSGGKKSLVTIAENLEDVMGDESEDVLERSLLPVESRASIPVLVDFESVDESHASSGQEGLSPGTIHDNSGSHDQVKHTDIITSTHIRPLAVPPGSPDPTQNMSSASLGKHAEETPSVFDKSSILDPAIRHAAKDSTSDWTVPLGPPAPEADDMMAASVVPDSIQPSSHSVENTASAPKYSAALSSLKRMLSLDTRATGSGSTIARRAAQANSSVGHSSIKVAIRANSLDKGHDDGYAAAVMFSEFEGSRLGFATQYMEDSIVALLASGGLQHGKEEGYRKGFVKGLEDGEMQVNKGILN